MDAKDMLRNKSFCPLPWTGFIVQQSGDVKNCVLSTDVKGNIGDTPVRDIMGNERNLDLKRDMLADRKPSNCAGCHRVEKNKNRFDIVSQRLYYLKELKTVDRGLYDDIANFNLHTVDLRWTNQCNQACVYCGPHNSSMWHKEVGGQRLMSAESKEQLKQYVFDNVHRLKNIYLAGGEPLLMNENQELLQLLLESNRDVNIRVNSNLSNIDTKVGKLLQKFKNVHWTVSVEATGDRYNYIRHGGDWQRFMTNLRSLVSRGQKISFNMLYFIMNYRELFTCIDTLRNLGFSDNAFIIGPVYKPTHLNILNLPRKKLDESRQLLQDRIASSEMFMKDSLQNILNYINTESLKPDFEKSLTEIAILDRRRQVDSRKIFPELYD